MSLTICIGYTNNFKDTVAVFKMGNEKFYGILFDMQQFSVFSLTRNLKREMLKKLYHVVSFTRNSKVKLNPNTKC